MFEIDQKARRLSDEEKEQYMKEGYITGLPVFSENAINDLHNLRFDYFKVPQINENHVFNYYFSELKNSIKL